MVDFIDKSNNDVELHFIARSYDLAVKKTNFILDDATAPKTRQRSNYQVRESLLGHVEKHLC
jgi:hypothetical protein